MLLSFQALIQGGSRQSSGVLSVTFDCAIERLSALPRMFIEPDGSFVWRGTDDDGTDWQVDGNLIDRGDALDYVELKGCCPPVRFNDLLRALGWPEQRLVFQLPQRGVVLEEAEFRRLAAAAEGAI